MNINPAFMLMSLVYVVGALVVHGPAQIASRGFVGEAAGRHHTMPIPSVSQAYEEAAGRRNTAPMSPLSNAFEEAAPESRTTPASTEPRAASTENSSKYNPASTHEAVPPSTPANSYPSPKLQYEMKYPGYRFWKA